MAMTGSRREARVFRPKLPEMDKSLIQQTRFTYDGPSDTLFMDFYGDSRPAVNVAVRDGDRDYLYLRVDPDTEQVVGVQLEAFLGYAIDLHPDVQALLAVADLYDVPNEEAARLRARGEAALDRWDVESFMADVGRLIAA